MDLVFFNSSFKLNFIAIDVSEKNTELVFSLILTTLVAIFGPPLLFAIIWFERFGGDKKRTLLNMFVNMNCWTCIASVILGQVPQIVIYTFGPLPHIFCNIFTVIRHSILCSILMYIDAIIVFRYVYIFKLKNPTAFRDDFWCLLVSVWIHLAGLILMATLNILENFQSLPNLICTGQITGLPQKVSGRGFVFVTFSSAILHFSINLTIYFHKRRFKTPSETHSISSTVIKWKNLEKDSLATVATDLLGICIFITVIACQQQLSAVQPENLQVYPNYLFLYYQDLLAPALGIICVILSFFRKKALRRNLKEQLKSWF